MAEMGNPLRVVLFGGIGSGKSTAAALMAEMGAHVIDADELGHAVLMVDGPAFADVAQRWPEVVESGAIDRSKLGAVVFSDPTSLIELEELTHPHIRAQIQNIVDRSGDQDLVLELPILREFVGEGWVRVLVDAPLDVRIDRAVARGLGRADAIARAAAQPSDAEYHEVADWVIANTGDLEDLKNAVGELWSQLAAT